MVENINRENDLPFFGICRVGLTSSKCILSLMSFWSRSRRIDNEQNHSMLREKLSALVEEREGNYRLNFFFKRDRSGVTFGRAHSA